MVFVLLGFGSVLIFHVARAWRLRRNRWWGAVFTASAAWLTLTGYALYYFASDANAAWLPIAHWLPGLLIPLAFVAHIRRGIDSRRRAGGR